MKRLLIIMIILAAAVCFADEYSDTALAASQAGVKTELANSLAQRTRAKGYSQQNMNRIKSMFSVQYGSSATKIAEKVMEGIAKNVPENNVVNAAEKVRNRYSEAMEVSKMTQVSNKYQDKITDLAAAAMTAGASSKNIEKTASELGNKKQNRDEYAVAVMSIYCEMVRYGVADVKAAAVAKKAMNNLSAQQINEYRYAFMRSAGSMNANSMADEMGSNMGKGYGASSMSSMGGSGSGSGGMGGGMGGSGSGSGSGGSGGSGGGHGGGGHR